MLEEFGLTKTEEKVYLALLKKGETTATDLIKKTQLHRTTVYDVLERLIEKGVVSFIIKNKVKNYSPASPSKFLDIALEEKNKAEEKIQKAEKIVKEIQEIKQNQKENSIVQVFIGEKGQRTIMDDIINQGKEFYVLGGGGTFSNSLPLYTKQWAEKRKKKKIKAKIIHTEKKEAPIWKLNEIRYLPKEYSFPSVNFIYGNKVAIFIHEEPLNMILIESEKVAKSYKNYFDLLWKIAKQ